MKETIKSNAMKFAFLTMGGAMLLAGCQATSTGEPLSEQEQQQWAESFTEQMVNNEISVQEGLSELESYLEVVEDEEFSNALEIFLYTLEVQADRYNTLLGNMTPEISDVLDNHEGITFNSDEGWKKVEDGLVKGLRKEVASQPLKWVESEETIHIEVDYDRLEEEFGNGMTETLENKIKLSQHRIQNPDYDYEKHHLDFANIFDRIQLLDEFKESGAWDSMMDDQYYYLTSIIYGFGEGTMNQSDGSLNPSVVHDMKEVAEKHKDHPVAQNMLKVLDKMIEEDSYNDEVLDFTNSLLNEQFADYFAQIEEEVEEELTEEETAESEVEEAEEEVAEEEADEGNFSAAGGE